jgi:hypothetical protein
MNETLAETRLRVRATMALERGQGFVIERDHEDRWDVWPIRPRGKATGTWWDDVAEVESRR